MGDDSAAPSTADLDEELLDLLGEALDGPDQVRIDLMTRWCLLRLHPGIDLNKPPPMPDIPRL